VLIRVGEILATCARCGGMDFEPLSKGELLHTSELRCAGCGNKERYLALLDQIGEEAMTRANKAIEELKKRPPR
jgi:hypothetical protein